ncbi:MAG: MAE_28990/MAE_18760 family HEPN-like nuclease [Cyanobacteria bacterium J06621_12]
MKLRTAEQLSDRLSNDLAWRKKELSEVKSLVENRTFSNSRHKAVVRSSICMLCAHWEGFVKLAANSYLEYVAMQKLCYGELSSNFLALAMKEKLKEAKETNKPSKYIPVCDFFLDEMLEKSTLPKDAISTASNLSSDVFEEITRILGIDFSSYSTKSVLIDTKLLKARNEIAHGEYSTSDRDEYLELHVEVINMLDLFSNDIQNAAITKDYLRSS